MDSLGDHKPPPRQLNSPLVHLNISHIRQWKNLCVPHRVPDHNKI